MLLTTYMPCHLSNTAKLLEKLPLIQSFHSDPFQLQMTETKSSVRYAHELTKFSAPNGENVEEVFGAAKGTQVNA